MDPKELLKSQQKLQQDKDKIGDLFGKLVSGKSGYKAVIDNTAPVKKCACGYILSGEEKFCPECGAKL